MKQESLVDVSVLWRGRQLKVATDSISDVKEFGLKLLELTKIKADTMKLLIPLPSNKGSKLLTPFSPEHVNLSLREAGILEGKPIRMMGVFEDEVEEVSQNNLKPDLRIIGFEEEEKRTRQRLLDRPEVSLKLPQGVFIFCDFRTLHIPGIELNPPASEALRRMHMLACDPGIIAIMNKHRWRVGIMTELAPVGYVGISPKCLLGFNKNHGEEISLRLRTDDLKGFRKYESIKKTLLHELAHMVHSEHDANFFALNKQLNEEAASLDWTKSRSHTLRGQKISKHYDDEFLVESTNYSTGQKLGGLALMASTSARASSVAAAYNRFVYSSTSSMEESQTDVKIKTGNTSRAVEKLEAIAAVEPDPDASMVELEYESGTDEPDPDDALLVVKDKMQIDHPTRPIVAVSSTKKIWDEPDPDDSALDGRTPEPDHDDSQNDEARSHCEEPDPDDPADISEPDPDDQANRTEPDPDDLETVKDGGHMKLKYFGEVHGEPDSNDCKPEVMLLDPRGQVEHNPDEALQLKFTCPEPDPDDKMAKLDSQELQRIEEPVAAICRRIEKAIKMLRSETTPLQAISSLQTLSKIIKNVIEHPDNAKFQRLRKGNALFQKNVANYKAAMEVLTVVGFCEDIVMDGIGRSETYMVLKRNDPGLLWLAKSSLEVSIA